MAQRPPVRPTLSSTRSSVRAKSEPMITLRSIAFVSDVHLMLRLLCTLSSKKYATTGHLMCYILEKLSEYGTNL